MKKREVDVAKAKKKKPAVAKKKVAAKKGAKKVAKKNVKKVAKKATKKVLKSAAKKAAAPKKKTVKVAKQKVAKKSASKATPVKAVASAPAKSAQPIDYSMILTPLDDRVLVRLTEAERKTAGGLFIPDTVADVSGNLEGVIVSVGRGHRDVKGRLRPLDVQLGDRVIFSSYAGSKFRFENEDLLLVRESELMGVVSK